jgi:hypothetical protein
MVVTCAWGVEAKQGGRVEVVGLQVHLSTEGTETGGDGKRRRLCVGRGQPKRRVVISRGIWMTMLTGHSWVLVL